MDVFDKDREPDLIAAFDDLTKQQRATAGEDAFADLQIDAALTKEIAELGQELTGHLSNQDLHLSRQNRGFTFDDLVNIAVFQMKSILGITLAEDAVVERNHTLLKTFDHSQVWLAIPQFQDIDGKADAADQFLAQASAQRFCSEEKYGDRYLEIAETAAIGRVLAAAGYGTQFCGNTDMLSGIIADAPIEMMDAEEDVPATQISSSTMPQPAPASVTPSPKPIPTTQPPQQTISSILSEGLTDVLNRIDANFADSGCDQKEVNNPYGADVVFNANAFIAMYCASKDTDVESISQSDLESLLNTHLDKLYAFTYQDESREVEGEPDPETGEATTETITVRVYTITYNGESYFSDEIFHLSEEQKALSNDYAQNLSVFLDDGSYQVLSSTEFSADGLSYEGVVFTDGETQVVYYNQLDERWKNLPYGTDDIGGYACGPTSMSIVVSSLTSETIDPPHMAQWAYENGYWASKSGSYHTLIPGAASSWGLACEGCSPSEPQRITAHARI